MNPIQILLQSTRPVILDGAMGTMLMRAGMTRGDCPELFNVEKPNAIRSIYRAYIDAGAQIVLSNTFGGNAFRLQNYGLAERQAELVEAGAQNLCLEVEAFSHPVIAAGSMGPTGEMLQPLGEISFEEAKETFATQAKALADGGVSLLWIETMSDLNELIAAIEGAQSVTDLPVTATMTFDTNGRTMMGVSPQQLLDAVAPYHLAAVGANCGNGPAEIEANIKAFRAIDPEITLISKSNAGLPKMVDGEIVYDGTPEVMAEHALRVRDMGADLIGGCCGTTPDHIRAMAQAFQT